MIIGTTRTIGWPTALKRRHINERLKAIRRWCDLHCEGQWSFGDEYIDFDSYDDALAFWLTFREPNKT